jgi:molybdopterin converting factor subunit 1
LAEDKVTCKILFFAAAAEASGQREKIVEASVGATVADVFASLSAESPTLHSLRKYCAFAIDEKVVQADTVVTNGCTIAVLPPVSGG